MRKPTVHLNGTDRETLFTGYAKAIQAIQTARGALAEVAPHGRDYYVQGDDAYTEATKEHLARDQKLQDIQRDLRELLDSVDE